jgi:hypothetical protein
MKRHLLIVLLSLLLSAEAYGEAYSFPVKCDGKTDMTAELQKCLASGSKHLYLPRGAGDCITTATLRKEG